MKSLVPLSGPNRAYSLRLQSLLNFVISDFYLKLIVQNVPRLRKKGILFLLAPLRRLQSASWPDPKKDRIRDDNNVVNKMRIQIPLLRARDEIALQAVVLMLQRERDKEPSAHHCTWEMSPPRFRNKHIIVSCMYSNAESMERRTEWMIVAYLGLQSFLVIFVTVAIRNEVFVPGLWHVGF